jgi:hypothetical protein
MRSGDIRHYCIVVGQMETYAAPLFDSEIVSQEGDLYSCCSVTIVKKRLLVAHIPQFRRELFRLLSIMLIVTNIWYVFS